MKRLLTILFVFMALFAGAQTQITYKVVNATDSITLRKLVSSQKQVLPYQRGPKGAIIRMGENGHWIWDSVSAGGKEFSFYFGFCDGCTSDTGWIMRNDSVIIDTAGGYCTTFIRNDTIFSCDTLAITNDGLWMKVGGILVPKHNEPISIVTNELGGYGTSNSIYARNNYVGGGDIYSTSGLRIDIPPFTGEEASWMFQYGMQIYAEPSPAVRMTHGIHISGRDNTDYTGIWMDNGSNNGTGMFIQGGKDGVIIHTGSGSAIQSQGHLKFEYAGRPSSFDSVLVRNSSTGHAQWVEKSAVGSTSAVTSVSGTSPVVSSGGTTPAISINSDSLTSWARRKDTATILLSRTRASHDYQPKGNYLTTAVTSVATGLGLSGGTITTSGTLAVDTANASILSRQRAVHEYQPKGNYLTSAVTSVGATSPLVSSGGNTPTISINTDSLAGLARRKDTSNLLLSQIRASHDYETKITLGTTGQYWRGDKTWQTLPTISPIDSVPWKHTLTLSKTILRNANDTVVIGENGTSIYNARFVDNGNALIKGALHSVGGTGDVNNSGTVNSTDALWIARYLYGSSPWWPKLIEGDMDGDGKISAADAILILGKLTAKFGGSTSIDSAHLYGSRLMGAALSTTLLPGQAQITKGLIIGNGTGTALVGSEVCDSIPATTGSGRSVLAVNIVAPSSTPDYSKSFNVKLDGKVGIGTSAPTQTLDLNGTMNIRNAPTGTSVDSVLMLENGQVKSVSVGTSTSAIWTSAVGTPTRASNTTFTVTGDYTSIFAKGLIIKWTESSTVRCGMVSIPSTYSNPNTTITIIGDVMASIDASSLKYCSIGAEMFLKNFAIAGTIGATGTDNANAYYATEPMRVIGADLQVGTAGTTNSTTIDINKGGVTMFTTKPTLASTVASSTTPFTADGATSLALGDKVTIDIDAVQTTKAVDLYVQLYLFPTRYLSLP